MYEWLVAEALLLQHKRLMTKWSELFQEQDIAIETWLPQRRRRTRNDGGLSVAVLVDGGTYGPSFLPDRL